MNSILCFVYTFLLSFGFGLAWNSRNENRNDLLNSLSLRQMLKLLKLESELIRNFDEYVSILQQKFNILSVLRNEVEAQHRATQFLSDPSNSFPLIRRLFADWPIFVEFMRQPVGAEKIQFVALKIVELPTSSQFLAAQAGLYAVQVAYELSAFDIANGLINGGQYNLSLSVLDCYALGKYIFNLEHFAHSMDWYNEARKKFRKGFAKLLHALGLNLGDIWLGILENYYNLHNYEAAVAAAESAVLHQPHNKLYVTHYEHLRNELSYYQTCRGQIQSTSNLHCHYDTNTTAYLKLAPVKIEQISRNPHIVTLHEIISEREIEHLKAIAEPHLKRTLTGSGIETPERTSSDTVFYDNATLVTRRIKNRIHHITGMVLTGSRRIQVINYGIGGHYYNHVDYYTSVPAHLKHLGNRKAAVLIYLSDVVQGGVTAFAAAKVGVPPQKGSAVLWVHLDAAGNGDPYSLHASCPVVYGIKWIAVKLLFDSPQMFRSPCPIKQATTALNS